jgi:hypothetical protein
VERKTRASRSGSLPPPPEDRTLDYAASREELRGIEPGEVVLAVEELEGFETVVRSGNKKFVKCKSYERDAAEFDFGNPLTFNDSLAAQYGRHRFNGQEGAFGSQFTQRFNLLRGKRWFYRQTQVNLEVAAVVTITHALSLERWRRQEQDPADAEPSEALAA